MKTIQRLLIPLLLFSTPLTAPLRADQAEIARLEREAAAHEGNADRLEKAAQSNDQLGNKADAKMCRDQAASERKLAKEKRNQAKKLKVKAAQAL